MGKVYSALNKYQAAVPKGVMAQFVQQNRPPCRNVFCQVRSFMAQAGQYVRIGIFCLFGLVVGLSLLAVVQLPSRASQAIPAPGEGSGFKGAVAAGNAGISRQQVVEFLNDWRLAWQNSAGKTGEVGAYMAFYDQDFSARGMDRKAWFHDKMAKNLGKEWIEVELEDIAVAGTGSADSVTVRFRQHYNSSNYSEISSKELVLGRRSDGAGLVILAERSVRK